MNELHALAKHCGVGYGERLRHNPEIELPPEFEQHVFLTPDSSLVAHPLLTQLAPDSLYRSTFDWRSFSMRGENDNSITVKGGDMARMREIGERFSHHILAERMWGRDIPGAGIEKKTVCEFESARTLQELARTALGRTISTPTPYHVMRIDDVETPAGRMSIKDYLNDPDLYFELEPQWRTTAGLLPREGLGDMLIDRYHLVPTQYLYRIPGPNVRVDDLYGSRLFRLPQIPHDPIDWAGANVKRGDLLPSQSDLKDALLRTIYTLLGESYDFDPSDVLPWEPIDESNYLQVVREIPETAQAKGINELVLTSFVERVTEAAALAHAHEHTFSTLTNMGSSLIARNVTYEGVVLDLDTFGEFARSPGEHIEQDVRELALTVGYLRRLVATRHSTRLAERVEQGYLAKLADFGAPQSVQNTAWVVLENSQDFRHVLNIL